jgi:hypothetical protein
VRTAHPTDNFLSQFTFDVESKSKPSTHLRRRYFCCLAGAVGEHMFELRGDEDFK